MSNLRKRDIMGIVEFDFKLLEDKIGNSSPFFYIRPKGKREKPLFRSSM